jgi:hypothetical protein
MGGVLALWHKKLFIGHMAGPSDGGYWLQLVWAIQGCLQILENNLSDSWITKKILKRENKPWPSHMPGWVSQGWASWGWFVLVLGTVDSFLLWVGTWAVLETKLPVMEAVASGWSRVPLWMISNHTFLLRTMPGQVTTLNNSILEDFIFIFPYFSESVIPFHQGL